MLASWLAGPRTPSVSVSPMLGLQGCTTMLTFLPGFWGSNPLHNKHLTDRPVSLAFGGIVFTKTKEITFLENKNI